MEMTDLRRYMEATVGKLTPAKAQEMARSIVGGQSKGRGQVQRVAQDLLEWSKTNRERMTEIVRREVREQLRSMGVATRDDVDALKKRVRELERASKPTARSTAKTTAERSSRAKRPTSRSAGSTRGSSSGSSGSAPGSSSGSSGSAPGSSSGSSGSAPGSMPDSPSSGGTSAS